jgi:hypothetical protein
LVDATVLAGRTVADMDNIGRKLNTELSSAIHAEKARFSREQPPIRGMHQLKMRSGPQDHADSEVSYFDLK